MKFDDVPDSYTPKYKKSISNIRESIQNHSFEDTDLVLDTYTIVYDEIKKKRIVSMNRY